MANRTGPNSWSNSWNATVRGEFHIREQQLANASLTFDGPIEGHFFNENAGTRDPYKGHLTLTLSPTLLSESDANTLEELSTALANENYAVRREAFKKALALPATAKNALKQILKQSNDPELRYAARELEKKASSAWTPEGSYLNWFTKELVPE